MSNWLRFILAVVVGAHGLGHVLFLVPLLVVADWGQPTRSWLLGAGWQARGIGSLLWLVAIICFAAVAFGLFKVTDRWRTVAIGAATVSSLGLLLFWVNPASSPILSDLVFNLLVLGALPVFRWRPWLSQPVKKRKFYENLSHTFTLGGSALFPNRI